MKAVRIDKFGGPEVTHLQDIEIPTLGSGEVLICVKAASINPVDFKTREGKFPLVTEKMLPLTLGRDVAGMIHALGPGAFDATVGDEVYVNLPFDQGGYANYAVAKAHLCARKPHSISWTEAASVPLAACTAWQGLFTHGGLGRGQRVLIHGASGGVGHFAVQFAHACGAKVHATASSQALELVEHLGADHVLDYKRQDFTDYFRDMDVVLDLVGGQARDKSFKTLRKNGILVSTLDQPSAELARQYGVRAKRFTTEPNREHLTAIARLIDEGRVRPLIAAEFPLAEYQDALRMVEREHPKGKVVLRVDP
jgi:NADPH:quinone reductase-like Zn-dependent oxidoreductase